MGDHAAWLWTMVGRCADAALGPIEARGPRPTCPVCRFPVSFARVHSTQIPPNDDFTTYQYHGVPVHGDCYDLLLTRRVILSDSGELWYATPDVPRNGMCQRRPLYLTVT